MFYMYNVYIPVCVCIKIKTMSSPFTQKISYKIISN